MKLQFDTTKTYAVALEGGGARGAYQVGVWRALAENGVRFSAVAGSSVGALNGALMAMEDLSTAESLWNDMNFSKVMDVDDRSMKLLFSGKFLELDVKHIHQSLKKIIRDGGFDVTPLKNLIKSTVDCEKIRNSPLRFFICTHSVTDRKALELEANTLSDEELRDMLLASAYFPAFKHEPLGGKMYTDAGVSNVLPLSPLINAGYKDIITIRIFGFGVEKKVRLQKGTAITEIAPKSDLGNMLNFEASSCRKNFKLGYFDAMRLLYGLYGERYYVDRTLSEADAYNILCDVVKNNRDEEFTLRQLHTELYKFSKDSGSKGDYYDVLIAYMEKSAEKLQIDELAIRTDVGLLEQISSSQ